MKEINENNDPSSRVVASRNLLNYTSIRFLRSNFSYYFSWQVFLGNIVPWTEHKFYTASSEFLCELCSARNCPPAWSCFILLYGHKVKCLLSPPSFPLHLSLTPSPRVPLRFPPPFPLPLRHTCRVRVMCFFFRIGRRACTVLSMMFAGVFCLLFSLASREFLKAGNWPSLFFWVSFDQ